MGIICTSREKEINREINQNKRNSRAKNNCESINIEGISFKDKKEINKSCNPKININNTNKIHNKEKNKQKIKNKNDEDNINKNSKKNNNTNKSSNNVNNSNKINKLKQDKGKDKNDLKNNNNNNKNKKSYSNMNQTYDYNLVCRKCKSIPNIKEVDYVKELNDFKIKYTCDCTEKNGDYAESYLINFINEEKVSKRIINFISLENRKKIIETVKENKNDSNGLQILEKLFEKKIIVNKKKIIQSITASSPAPLNDGKKYIIDYYKSEIQNSNNNLPLSNNLKDNQNNEQNDSDIQEKPSQNVLEDFRNEVQD